MIRNTHRGARRRFSRDCCSRARDISGERALAVERLIGVLEVAVAQMGRVYLPHSRATFDPMNQLARLRAAHAAYALASGARSINRGIRAEGSAVRTVPAHRRHSL